MIEVERSFGRCFVSRDNWRGLPGVASTALCFSLVGKLQYLFCRVLRANCLAKYVLRKFKMFARIQRINPTRLLHLRRQILSCPPTSALPKHSSPCPSQTLQFSTSIPRRARKSATKLSKVPEPLPKRKNDEEDQSFWTTIRREGLVEIAQLGCILLAVMAYTVISDHVRWVMMVHYGRRLDRFAVKPEEKSNVIEKEGKKEPFEREIWDGMAV